MKRIMVDMSATLIHHGHVRLIKRAAEYGEVVIGLTTDDEIETKKGYVPELLYEHRKEVLEALSFVKEVVPTPWLISEDVMAKYNIDLLVHGHDNANDIPQEKLLTFPRTEDISSTEIRHNAGRSMAQIKNRKLMLTPGPGAVPYEATKELRPLFGRGDEDYTQMCAEVTDWVKGLSGQDEVVFAQGSASFGLELAAHTFVRGKVLLVSTGYYSDRLENLLPSGCEVTKCRYVDVENVSGDFDWLMCAYTETSCAIKVNLAKIRKIANDCGAALYVDATGSIGLEDQHELADVMAFSSCKGLFGITGAAFVAFKKHLTTQRADQFYLNFQTHLERRVTGPYHAIASLHGIMSIHTNIVQRVRRSKRYVLDKWPDLVTVNSEEQPLLCTYIDAKVTTDDNNVVLYTPRSDLKGSVVCHFGEVHWDKITIGDRISVGKLD